MVTLYVAGRKVDWADAGRVLADRAAFAERIELRDESGQVVNRLRSEFVAFDDDPDWVKAITPEAIERAKQEPGFTFEEVKKRLGWR
ncbi:hypothetical protein [Gemmata sp.]|uniref:hypothetical protein n=1 Tax=Gemmata sp. TaxID=1914242 RepID=UPI003F71DCC1